MRPSIHALVLVACVAACQAETEEELVGHAALPVWPGSSTTVDAGNQYQRVVAIAGASGVGCSGVLITRAGSCRLHIALVTPRLTAM